MLAGDVLSNTDLVRVLSFAGGAIGRGSTAPTDVLLGTSPEVPALLFDAVAETGAIYVGFKPDMDLTADFTLVLQYALVNAQSNGHVLDVTIDYVVPLLGTTGNGPTKASTQLLPTQTLTTGEGLAVGDIYEMSQAIAFGDATNPFASGAGIALEMHLTNLTDVAAIHLLDARLRYSALY